MFWKKLWASLKSLWAKITRCDTSGKNNTVLDTASVELFGLSIKITREIPVTVPYELTVVIPRAEYRWNQDNQEIILNSITIAHSPRHQGQQCSKQPPLSKAKAA